MKQTIIILSMLFGTLCQAQEIKNIPMINVSGEGKVKTEPDQALISIAIESKGSSAVEVKKENDEKMDAILKSIKKANISKEDFQTQRVTLNPSYDYVKKKSNYTASQSISILLKDLSKYDALIQELVGEGINRINSVEYKTSKLTQLQSDARKLAIKDAKAKAEDFVSVLGQKVGKAIFISDDSSNSNPRPIMYATMKSSAMVASESDTNYKETIAIGEIEIIVNVSVSFLLE